MPSTIHVTKYCPPYKTAHLYLMVLVETICFKHILYLYILNRMSFKFI